MALKSNYDSGRFEKEVSEQVDSLNERILAEFIRAGEKFVTEAREQEQSHELGHYKDVTSNLRNSICCFVFLDGELVHENQIGNAVENKQIAQELVLPKGFQLIGIAGKNYASYVESKGYNVISYQADTCMVELATYLETLEVIEKGTGAGIEESFIPHEL